MQIALLGDTHFGIKQFSRQFLENQLNFFHHQFFPYLKENNITEIFQFGDIFDNRRIIDIDFLSVIDERFFKKIVEEGFHLTILLGNHDIYYKNKREINLISFFERLYPENITLISEKTHINVGDRNILIFPWLVQDEKIYIEEIEKYDLIFGHFEMKGFEVIKGYKSEKGLNPDFFKHSEKLKGVFSGHFHLKNTDGFITYLGTPYQIDWNDFNTEKGFFIYDLDTMNYKFIENTKSKKYVKIIYDDSRHKGFTIEGLGEKIAFDSNEFDKFEEVFENSIIKVVINEAENQYYEELLFYFKNKNVKYTLVDNTTLEDFHIKEVDYRDLDPESLFIETVSNFDKSLIDKARGLLNEVKIVS